MKKQKEFSKYQFAYSSVSRCDKHRIFIRHAVTLILSLIFGVLFGGILVSGIFVAKNHLRALEYVNTLAVDYKNAAEFLLSVIKDLYLEITTILFILFATFTVSRVFITDLLLFAYSFINAFISLFMLRSSLNEFLLPRLSGRYALAYAISRLIIHIMLFCFICRISLVQSELKYVGDDGNIKINKKKVFLLVAYSLSELGAIILVGIIYRLIIFL